MYFFKLLGIRFLKFDKNIPKIKINTNEGSFKKSFPISYASIKRARDLYFFHFLSICESTISVKVC